MGPIGPTLICWVRLAPFLLGLIPFHRNGIRLILCKKDNIINQTATGPSTTNLGPDVFYVQSDFAGIKHTDSGNL